MVLRKIATLVLIVSLALLAVEGNAADNDTPKKGFVLFGLSQLYDGTGEIQGGAGELLDGNQLLVEGLDSLGSALDGDIAGNLQTMKTGIDGEILPGLGSILAGITGKVVPGVEDIREGLEDKMSPGLEKMLAAFDGQLIPGLQQIGAGIGKDMVGGLDKILGGLGLQMVPGLGQLKDGLTDQLSPGLGNLIAGIAKVDGTGEEPGLIQGLNQVDEGLRDLKDNLVGIGVMLGDISFMQFDDDGTEADLPKLGRVKGYIITSYTDPTDPTSLSNDQAAFAIASTDEFDDFDGSTIEVPLFGTEGLVGFAQAQVVGNAVVISAEPYETVPLAEVIGGIIAVKEGFVSGAISDVGTALKDGLVAQGVGGLSVGVGKIRAGIAALDGEGKPKVTFDGDGRPDTLYAGLVALKEGVDSQMAPGLDQLLAGFNRTAKADGESGVIEGLGQIRGGLAGPVGAGLDGVITGLAGEIVPGMTAIKEGMDDVMIPGTYKLLDGFNKTKAATGESGIIEGLTKISRGLANPLFTPNPGGDPGVSDGLGLVITGIRTDVLGGIGELKGGIVKKIIPGLEKMISGITGELQPGFTKVSLLLLAAWLVSVLVFLGVGILIGRAVKAKASAGGSVSA